MAGQAFRYAVLFIAVLISSTTAFVVNRNTVTVKVQTYNVQNFNDGGLTWEERIPKIVATIFAQKADIIAIQELRNDTSGRDMYSDLKQALAPHYNYSVFYPGMFYPAPQYYRYNTTEGQAVFSMHPLTETAVTTFPLSTHDANRRICIYAKVAHPAGDIDVFATHLSYDSRDQMDNAQWLVPIVAETITTNTAVIMGDFNIRHEYDPLQGYLVNTAHWTDAWLASNSTADGCTYECFGGDHGRIDRIWFPSDPYTTVLSAEVVGDASSSDHRSIVAEIRFGQFSGVHASKFDREGPLRFVFARRV
eukprot:Colp12_sorted_trinity150504_noHs@33771